MAVQYYRWIRNKREGGINILAPGISSHHGLETTSVDAVYDQHRVLMEGEKAILFLEFSLKLFIGWGSVCLINVKFGQKLMSNVFCSHSSISFSHFGLSVFPNSLCNLKQFQYSYTVTSIAGSADALFAHNRFA